jgi:adenylate cyclase
MNKLRILSLERTGTDTDTTVIVPGIAGDSHPARGMRLRVQFDDRELLVDERRSSITIGRAVDNDLVVKGHLISRLHARIEISRNKFVILIDQSTNGTFVQTDDEEELFIRQDIFQLKRRGMIGLGRPPEQGSPHTIHFSCEQILTGQAPTSDLPETSHRGR